jgi:excisionase family DNA binding protein
MALEIKNDGLYKISELSRELNVNKDTLRRHIRAGKLRANKVGRELVVWGSDFREFVNSRGRETKAGYGDRDLLTRTLKKQGKGKLSSPRSGRKK